MILTITKINAEDVNFDLFVANGTVDEPWAVFEFGELDDVIELAKLVKDGADSDSALYKYNERYELYVHDVNGIAEEMRGHFVEYGEMTQMTREFLDEHGQLLISEKALMVLGNL